jgi:hypothetical protein
MNALVTRNRLRLTMEACDVLAVAGLQVGYAAFFPAFSFAQRAR